MHTSPCMPSASTAITSFPTSSPAVVPPFKFLDNTSDQQHPTLSSESLTTSTASEFGPSPQTSSLTLPTLPHSHTRSTSKTTTHTEMNTETHSRALLQPVQLESNRRHHQQTQSVPSSSKVRSSLPLASCINKLHGSSNGSAHINNPASIRAIFDAASPPLATTADPSQENPCGSYFRPAGSTATTALAQVTTKATDKPCPQEEELVRRIHRKVGGPAKLSTYDEPARVRRVVIEALATEQRSPADATRVRRGLLSALERRVVRTVTNRGAAVRSRMRQRKELATLRMQVRDREGRVKQLEAIVRAMCATYSVPLPPTVPQTEDHRMDPYSQFSEYGTNEHYLQNEALYKEQDLYKQVQCQQEAPTETATTGQAHPGEHHPFRLPFPIQHNNATHLHSTPQTQPVDTGLCT